MAPKVVVPADFGIENLYCEFHGNVVLKLQGGEDIKANSLILSYHSSVFVRLFLELNQSVLEMDDLFTKCVRLAYYLPQSASTKISCPQSGSCGFILETEPILKDRDPYKFKASISCDLSKYPDDLHWHPEINKIQEMHLMLSWFDEDDFDDITKRVSYPGTLIWNGKGVQSTGCSSYPEWNIDPGYNFEPEEHVELVVFM